MPESVSVRLNEPRLERVLRRVVVTPEVRDHPRTAGILDRAREAGLDVLEELPNTDKPSLNRRYRYEKQTLVLRLNQGSFIKPWESPPSIVGRDEWCLTPVEGCPFDCSYCYLQDYLDRPLVTAYVNQDAMVEHVRGFLDDPPEDPPHFFSLGELSDGLLLEPLLRSVPVVWEAFRSGPAKLEVRTKSHHVHSVVDTLKPHPNGVFTWSLSPPGRDRRREMLTAPLDQRLAALKTMLEEGFRVAVRLDPILLDGEWFEPYVKLVERMDDYIDLEELTFLLVGTFRFPAGFDRTMEERFSNRTFLKDEFVKGPDGKYRYARFRRTEAYRALGDLLREYGGTPNLCMEPEYVWEDAGYA